jgi:hypothetical protein
VVGSADELADGAELLGAAGSVLPAVQPARSSSAVAPHTPTGAFHFVLMIDYYSRTRPGAPPATDG